MFLLFYIIVLSFGIGPCLRVRTSGSMNSGLHPSNELGHLRNDTTTPSGRTRYIVI